MGNPVPTATIWTNGNRYSSKGQTQRVELQGLPPNATEMCGQLVCIDEYNASGQRITCNPFDTNDGPASRCFPQKVAYQSLDSFQRFLSDELDCDMQLVRAIMRHRNPRPLHVVINVPNTINAYYNPPAENILVGDGEGRCQIATDHDILLHESGHWVIDTINPTLADGFLGLGMAVHEGGADAIAALKTSDAQIGEDFNVCRHGYGYAGGVRSVNNTRTFRNVTDPDPHEVGKVFSGFWWSLAQRLDGALRSRDPRLAAHPAEAWALARKATIKLVFTNAGSYKAPSPLPVDFIDATVAAAKGLIDAEELNELTAHGVDLARITQEVQAEATSREFAWMNQQLLQDMGAPTAIATLAFGKPIELFDARGGRALFRPQVLQTRHGEALVAGYGYFQRGDGRGISAGSAPRLRRIDQEKIDVTLGVTKEKALELAIAAAETDFAALLAKRTADLEIPAISRMRLIREAREALKAKGARGARLAILPKGKNLVWLFDAGLAHIAIDAPTGKATIIMKTIID